MPWPEIRRTRFEATPDVHGRPSRVHIEFIGNEPSLLPAKQIGAVYFCLAPGLSWDEADALAETLNRHLKATVFRHLAAGEQ